MAKQLKTNQDFEFNSKFSSLNSEDFRYGIYKK